MEQIRRLRKARGLSQAKLAVKAGMDPATLNRLEQGKGNPNLQTLERVAYALDVEVIDLFPKAQAPLPLEEDQEQRGAPFLEAWKSYMLKRARTWEQALEEEGDDLFGDPQFVFDALYRNELVQTEAAELLAAVISAVLPGGLLLGREAEDLARVGTNERAGLGRAFLAVAKAAGEWGHGTDAAWKAAGEEAERRKLPRRARERTEKAIQKREGMVWLFEEWRAA